MPRFVWAVAGRAARAAQVQEFHRQLFKSSVDLLREEIKRITGVAVGEAAAEVETTTAALSGRRLQINKARITRQTFASEGH